MPQLLPFTPSEAFQEFSTTLDGTDYTILAQWNGRNASWSMDLLDADGVIIRAGSRIALGSFPGRRSADARFPEGVFVVLDTSGEGIDATLDDLGTRVLVHYYTPEEFEAIG